MLQHDLGPAELPAAMLNSANLERAKMTGAMAVQADFTDAMMKGCRLTRAIEIVDRMMSRSTPGTTGSLPSPPPEPAAQAGRIGKSR